MNHFSNKLKEKYVEVYKEAINKFINTEKEQYIFIEMNTDSLVINDIFSSNEPTQKSIDEHMITMNTETIFEVDEDIEDVYENSKLFKKYLNDNKYFEDLDSIIEDNIFYSDLL